MRTIGWFLLSCFLCSGCLLDRGPIALAAHDATRDVDAGVTWPDAGHALGDACHSDPDASTLSPIVTWPRSHPVGTLLVDHDDALWMVIEQGIRAPVSGDDTLGNISLDEGDATPMTLEEERCLRPADDYWGPGNWDWWPVYGPDEADPGPFILNGVTRTRRPVSNEALESWGYYWRWMDYFDGGEDEWLSYAFDPEPIPLRDGTLVHTEHGFYYVVHGRSFYFRPSELVAQAGYHPESAIWMRDTRLRELAPVSTALDYETFNLCPADWE
jgi:hypothetical protein